MINARNVSSLAAQLLSHLEPRLVNLFQTHDVPDSHGLNHALIVMEHGLKSILSAEADTSKNAACPNEIEKAAVLLACFLHDADDHKYFPDKGLANAERLLDIAIGLEEELGNLSKINGAKLRELTLTMIGFVSASSNGNSIPVEAENAPWLLWPRWCDRLEAVGIIGVVRCWQHTLDCGQPFHRPGLSPQPQTEEDMWDLVKEEQFKAYQDRGGKSLSMIDHFYDKLLHLPGGLLKYPEFPRAPYLISEMKKRVAPLVQVCLAYGLNKGELPHQLFKDMLCSIETNQSSSVVSH